MPTGLVGKRQQQPGLAHPSVAGHQHQLWLTLLGPIQSRLEPAQLSSPTDERPRWLLFCVWFVCDLLSWQTPGALSPHPEDLS